MIEAPAIIRRPDTIRKLQIGDTFGLWTVTGERIAGSKRLKRKPTIPCKCRCGTERNVTIYYLRKGLSQSCGCHNPAAIIDLTGQKFGRLTVIKQSVKIARGGNIKWECVCDCGKAISTTSYSLRIKNTKSCGCLKIERLIERSILPENEGLFREFFLRYRFGADQRGFSFNLTRPFFDKMVKQNCYYCGTPPAQVTRRSRATNFFFSGIDRIDSKIGYEESNVVPCCSVCNIAKNDTPQSEFLDWIKRVATHMNLMHPSPQQPQNAHESNPQSE